MKNRAVRNIFCMVLIAATLVNTGISACAGWYDSENESHTDLNFSDLKYEGIDKGKIDSLVEKLKQDIKIENNNENVVGDFNALVAAVDDASFQYSMANIMYDNECINEEYKAAQDDCYDKLVDIYDEVTIALREALSSEYKDEIANEIGNDKVVEDILDYEDMTPEEKELSERQNDLVQQYDEVSTKEYSIEYNECEYTYESAQAAYYNGQIEYEDYYNIYYGILQKENDAEAEVYPELVKIRNRMAEIAGYDNYAKYAYEKVYSRDYSFEEIEEVYDAVKEYIVPWVTKVEEEYAWDGTLDYTGSGEEQIELLAPYMELIDPELLEAFNYMSDHGFYDLDESATKLDIGYTTSFSNLGAPFIFNSPEEGWQRVETLVHEYGHYNAAYHNMEHDLFELVNMDVAEINSQGLEVLFLDYADELYGEENADEVRINVLYQLMSVVVSGCLMDEFQIAVYEYEGDLDVATVNSIYKDIASEYGYYFDEDNAGWGWAQITHTFESPMYYISYATSALAALDLFELSLEDRQAAIDGYMKLSTYGNNVTYHEALEIMGVSDVFEINTIARIADGVDEYTEDMLARHTYKSDANILEDIPLNVIAIILVIVLVLLILLIIIIKSQEKNTYINEDENK